MCLYPKFVDNPKYKRNKKNGGNIPPVTDERVKKVPIGCSKCIECTKQRSRGWQVRLLEEIKTSKNGKFITLTFTNENYTKLCNDVKKKLPLAEGYDLDNQVATLAMRRFLQNWYKKYKKPLRHWFVTELGHEGTEHLHLHGIVWTEAYMSDLEKVWAHGFVWKGKRMQRGNQFWFHNYVNESTISYMTKYMTKVDLQHKEYKPIILTSPGIGRGYVSHNLNSYKNKFNPKGKTDEGYRTNTGHKIALPIYYRNKIYSDSEREQLWIQKLDEKTRWVCGEKVDVSKNDEEYYKLLEYYRQRNKRLGYGDDQINWNRRQYELDLRKLKQAQRALKQK